MDVLASKSMFALDVDWAPGSTLVDAERKVRFDPPLYLQRYSLVMQTLEVKQWADEFHKVCNANVHVVLLLLCCIFVFSFNVGR